MSTSRLEELKAQRRLLELKQKRDALIAQRDQEQPKPVEEKKVEMPSEKPTLGNMIKKSIEFIDAPRRLANRAQTDIGAGIASAAENVYATIPELMGHEMPRHDWAEMAGVKDQGMADKILQAGGKMIPAAALAPLGFWPGVAGAGAYGFTQVEPGQQGLIDRVAGVKPDTGITGRTRNAIEDALLAMLGGGIAKAGANTIEKGARSEIGSAILKKLGMEPFTPPSLKQSRLGGKPDPSEAFNVEAKFGEPQRFTSYGEQENPLMNQQARFGEEPSQFNNIQRQSPEYLRYNESAPAIPALTEEPVSPLHGIEPSQIPVRSQTASEHVYDYLSGGRNLEEAAKEAASHAKTTFGRVEGIGNKKYDQIFRAPEFMNEKGNPKTYERLLGDKETRKHWEEMADNENKVVFNNFVKSPTLEDAQKAKSELAVEKRNFEKIRKTRTLTPEEKIEYRSVIYRHDLLEREMNNIIKEEAPHLENALGEANNYWRNNVSNWYGDKSLFRIAKGRETNPSSATLAGIFKNPEPEMLRVVQEMGEPGQRAILLHGIGKAKGNYSPELLENILPALEERGLLSHITPEFRSHIGELKSHIQGEKSLGQAIRETKEQVKLARQENKAKLSAHQKEMTVHEKQKAMRDNIIAQMMKVEPSAEALPGYKGMELSYPKAQKESEKIVAEAGKKHESLSKELNKWLEKDAENKRAAMAHAAAVGVGALSGNKFLGAYKLARILQRSVGKAARTIRSK